VAILDADDVWLPDTLPDQVMILEARPAAALVYGRVQRWYSWSGITDDRQRDSFRELAVPADSLVEPPTQLVLLLQDKGMPSGFMIRREVMQRVGGYEESFRGMYEDNAFLVKVCLRNAVFASNECWYRYRKHQQSASSLAVSAGRYQTARLEFLKWVETYLANEQIVDPRIWNVLRRELRPLRHPRLHQLIDRARGWFRLRSELSPR
jgi:GT2 family glycosyltransferase